MTCATDLVAMDRPLIVGLGVRLPGAPNPDAAWQVLSEGRSTIGQLSPRYFDPAYYHDPKVARPGKTYSLAAGQIDHLYDFDAGFFGISPREAAEMDPQQRLMLQTTWEAVEDAGLNIRDLAGERTGVFIGASQVESLPSYYLDPGRGGAHFALGNALSIIANRISSTFDFRGPSYVVDTACSSGLFALHQGAEALRSGAIDTAIVGGVHVLRTTGGFVGFSQAKMLSPTGLCRAFDAAADGYVRSEAAIAVILMKPERAASLSPRLRARLLATGVNSDGAARRLSVPSSKRQASVIKSVLASSGRDPEDISYYEAHGTGTAVGDPAEATGLGEALGMMRRIPLQIGAAKTNFGHAEPASGLVGLTKLLLALEHGIIPPSLHFDTPNPEIDFERLNLEVVAKPIPLPQGRTVCLGVSSFGFGGTNAAAIIEGVEDRAKGAAYLPDEPWLHLSAASAASLTTLAAVWTERLNTATTEDRAKLLASAARRAELAWRVALPARDLADGLPDFQQTDPAARTVFAFAGSGAETDRMGQVAYRENTAFKATFDSVAEAFETEGLRNLHQLRASGLGEVERSSPLAIQPLLFACQVAEARAHLASGIIPEAVIGHSLGEIAALHISGALDLENAARVIARRAVRFEALRGSGGMLTVAAPVADVARVLSGFDDRIVIAAVNSPNSVTVSGPSALLTRFARTNSNGKPMALIRLGAPLAYHSPALDPLEAAFFADLTDIAFEPPHIPVASSTLGRMLVPSDLMPAYLWANARNRVEFHKALTALAGETRNLLLEVSPKPVLAANVRDTARFDGLALAHVALGAPGSDHLAHAACAWAKGVRVEREKVFGKVEKPMTMPNYPWDAQEHFAEMTADGIDGFGEFSKGALAGHRPERDGHLWITELTPTQPSWIKDHRIGGRIVLSTSTLVEIALSAGHELWPDAALELSGFSILHPAEITGEGVRLRTTIDQTTGVITLEMRPRLVAVPWVIMARGGIRQTALSPIGKEALNPKWDRDAPPLIYKGLTLLGLDYGPAFQALEALAPLGKDKVRSKIRCKSDVEEFCLSPTGLDGVFQSLAGLMGKQSLAKTDAMVPVRIGRLIWSGVPKAVASGDTRISKRRKISMTADVTVYCDLGIPLAQLDEVEFLSLPSLGPKSMPALKRWVTRYPVWHAPDALVSPAKGWAQPMAALGRLGYRSDASRVSGKSAFDQLDSALRNNGPVEPSLAALWQDAPHLLDDARVRIAAARGRRDFSLMQHTAANQAVWREADRVLQALIKAWRRGARLNLLIAGLPDFATLKRWVTLEVLSDLTVYHPDPELMNYLEVALPNEVKPALRPEPATGAADVVLSLGDPLPNDVRERLAAPGALLLEIQHALGDDVISDPDCIYTLADDIPLAAKAYRTGTATQTEPRTLDLLASLPNGFSALPMANHKDGAGTPTLFFAHDQSQSASQSLEVILAQIKPYMGKIHRLLVILWHQGGMGFSALASGMAAALRSLANELPDTQFSLVAVKSPPPEALWPALIAASDDEPFLFVDGQGVRLMRVAAGAQELLKGRNTTLKRPQTGLEFTWVPTPRRNPKAGEIALEVAATGLNLRDVLWAKGRLPDRLFDAGSRPPGMGLEVAGHVTATGAGTRLRKGQSVMGFSVAGFGRHLILPETSLCETPKGLTLEQAAGVPVAFLTAWDSLVRVARLGKGERILIHAATGGVGMAAIQIAKWLGAEILATAGTPEKRDIARAMGAESVFDSRDLGFVEGVAEATGSTGVDVVLNSLAGPAMRASLDCLAPFGRFVELGKRDFVDNTLVGLGPFVRNLSYLSYDLDQRLTGEPKALKKSFSDLVKAFERGVLRPLPTRAFPPEAVLDAFHHMQAAQHIGKLVVAPAVPKRSKTWRKLNGVWVILGGTGGIGLALALALRAAGASEVHLVSRSGRAGITGSPDRAAASADRAIRFHATDASDPEALSATLAGIQHPVQGIIHAATTLRDRLFRDFDRREAQAVIGSKLGVAEALNAVLERGVIAPAHLLYLSSVSALIGTPGQVAYAAANGALEGFAETQRAAGLNAHVLALGPVEGRGSLARDAVKHKHIEAQAGIGFLSLEEALDAILNKLRRDKGQNALVARLDWSELSIDFAALRTATFEQVIPQNARQMRREAVLADELAALPWAKALERANLVLSAALCQIMRLPKEQIDLRQPLAKTGVDSLMAMELRLTIERRFGISLPLAGLSETTTPADLTVSILRKLKEVSE